MPCGNLDKFGASIPVQDILKRMQKHSLLMQNYCLTIPTPNDSFGGKPYGFNFVCGKVKELLEALRSHPRFGLATAYFDIRKGCFSFREVGLPDSIHVILHRRAGGQSIIHLDSISIAVAKDFSNGNVIYNDDLGVLINHNRVDLQHKHALD